MILSQILKIPKALARGHLLSLQLGKSSTQLETIQNRALWKTISTAYYETAFFREKFDRYGVHPRDITTIDDLTKLPVTTKKELVENLEETLPKSLNKKSAIITGTSGTTGQPIHVYKDFDWVAHLFAFIFFYLKFQKMKSLKPAFIADITTDASIENRVRSFVNLFFRKTLIIPVEKDMLEIMKLLEQSDVNFIGTYTGVMRELATLKKNGMGKNLRIKKALIGGEVVDEYTREYIEEAFGCTCYSLYASTEGGIISFECEHKKMHVNSASVIVEVVDQDGRPVKKGQEGRILLTCIDGGSGTPVIRYNGCADVGSILPETCVCGLSTPILGPIQGRIVDSIHLPDGRIFHAFAMMAPLWEIRKKHTKDLIHKYQIVQHEVDKITISFVRNQINVTSEDELLQLAQTVKDRYQTILGKDITITVQEVKKLPRSRNLGIPTPPVLSKVGRKILESGPY